MKHHMQCQMLVMKQAVETLPLEKLNHMYTLSCTELRGIYKAFRAIAHDVAADWQLRNMPLIHTEDKALVLTQPMSISDQHFLGSACMP